MKTQYGHICANVGTLREIIKDIYAVRNAGRNGMATWMYNQDKRIAWLIFRWGPKIYLECYPKGAKPNIGECPV